jgi:hypothetical protein
MGLGVTIGSVVADQSGEASECGGEMDPERQMGKHTLIERI